jgi:hypothetical protein
MKTTNLQLIQEINSIKQQLSIYQVPTKLKMTDNTTSYNLPLNSARSGAATLPLSNRAGRSSRLSMIGEDDFDVRSAIVNTFQSLNMK